MADETAELALLNRPDFDELIANADRYFQENKPALSAEELLLRDPEFDRLLKEAEAYLFPTTTPVIPDSSVIPADAGIQKIDRFKIPKIKLPTFKKPSLSRQQGHNLARAGTAGVIAAAATLTPQVQPPQISLPQINTHHLVAEAGSSANQIAGQISERVPRWDWSQEAKPAQAAPKDVEPEIERSPLTERATPILFPDHEKHRQQVLAKNPKLEQSVDPEINKGRINILLIGEGAESYLPYADATIMASLNPKKNKLDLVSLHRDTYAPEITAYAEKKGEPKGSKYEIMRALEFGGVPLLEEIAANNLGLSPDYFVKFKISGVVKLIDKAFGKIKIDVPNEVPDDGTGISFPKGEQYLDGNLAQYYMRSRQTTGVERRMSAQEQVMESMMGEVLYRLQHSSPPEREKFLTNFRDTLVELQESGEIDTNYDLNRLSRLLDKVNQWSNPVTQFIQEKMVDNLYKKPHITKTVFSDFAELGKIPGNTGPRDALRAYIDPQTKDLMIPDTDDTQKLVDSYYKVSRAKVRQLLSNDPDAQVLVKVLSTEINPSLPRLTLTPTPEEIKFQGHRGDVDSNSPIHWDKDTVYLFNSTLEGTTRYSGKDIEHLGQGEKVTIDKKFNGGVWIEATYKDPKSGDLYGWYHHEPANILPSKTAAVDYLTTPKIGAMVSKDNGKNWHDLGFILENNEIDRETTNMYFAGGNGDFSVIPDREGEHLYFLYTSYDPEKSQQGIKVARTKTEDLAKPEGKLEQLNDGNPVIEAKSDIHQKGADFFWGPSVHFNKELGMYVILLNHAQNDSWDQEGIYTIYAKDLSDPKSWSAPQKIELPVGVSEWYPQVLGTDKGDTDKEVSQHPRLVIRGESNKEINFLKPQ